MKRVNSLVKTPMLGKIKGKEREQHRMRWLYSITDSMDMNLSKLREIIKAKVPGVLQCMWSQRVVCDFETEQQ